MIRHHKNSNSSNRTLWKTSPIHIVRIHVELAFYYLFVYKTIPELMTFAGRNFDNLSGLTAPIITFLLDKKMIGRKVFLIWNIASLGLLAFIVVNAILSVESPFQQFGLDQPNRALSYFSYILLPATVATLVMYTYVVDM